MKEPRNPFRMRTSEHIESDGTFLRLFSPRVLELITENSWDRVQIFRSAPGGGKTSLFRVFTSSALLKLYGSRTSEDYKELYRKMEGLGVISEKGPHTLGIMLSCAQSFSSLQDLEIDPGQKERLLYSLLNARIVLAALRGALILRNLDYPHDLEHLNIAAVSYLPEWLQIPIPGTGRVLFEWATQVEQAICETIDSFDTRPVEALRGHDSLYALAIIRPEAILCDEQPVAERTIVMLDDVHKLTPFQREKLLDTLFHIRPPIGVWIAERLQALEPTELLATGVTTGREYLEPIKLEEYWRESKNKKLFENIVTNIADRRARWTNDFQGSSFGGSLQESLHEAQWQKHLDSIAYTIAKRVYSRDSSEDEFETWFDQREASHLETPWERAIAWRKLEILFERERRNQQLALLPPSAEELERKETASDIRAAAELFLAREFDIPYYFGFSELAALSSSNIDQFLAFAGELFEQMISAALINEPTTLPAATQQTILKKATKQRWDDILRRVPNGNDAQNLLQAIQHFALSETELPNAPYAPGVTGVGLSLRDQDRLIDSKLYALHPEYKRLAFTISACVSNNLIEPRTISQGQKGQKQTVLYLNRWLCLHVGLPLHYGGWRPVSLDRLCQWLERGFQPTRGGLNLL
jgi:hypothetical protein